MSFYRELKVTAERPDGKTETLVLSFTNEKALHTAAFELAGKGFETQISAHSIQTYRNADDAVQSARDFFHK